jgi:hypothetical protein
VKRAKKYKATARKAEFWITAAGGLSSIRDNGRAKPSAKLAR